MDFVITGDGSKTLYHAEVGECYHSKHGAYQESIHVFLKSGLQFFLEKENKRSASILEVGFGTGLNFLLTADYCNSSDIQLDYCGIEAFPLPLEIIAETGYKHYIPEPLWEDYLANYNTALACPVMLDRSIILRIAHIPALDFNADERFDVIYFDAFAAIHQPEMWNEKTLTHVTTFLKPGGVFVTYAITGNLKRTMKALGFEIEKVPGAPGKREMLRAVKRNDMT
ncbi:MAG TPA: tRNA (5-methylaminomethyl-2-thiouridine)(34)-methyltransferase MnmD [Sphingobacterium sp.]|nr:tRNA (5-methylaminomethyl-2-thiouridine)(34)-methyltransferase MnmD [Sphingobacterium sp.]